MLYYVRRFPDAGTEGQQGEALARLVANAGSLTVHTVRVGGTAGLYIDVPEAVRALVELRVLPGLVGMEGCLERRRAWVQRPEWALHALLAPTRAAQPLEVTLLDGASSACLTLHWRKESVAGHLYASADDLPLIDAIEQRGWQVRVVRGGMAGRLALLLQRPRATTLQPILALRPPASAAPPPAPLPPAAAAASAPAEAAPPSFVAAPGAPGLVLGMGAPGMALALAFRPQRLAVEARADALPELVATLLERALGLQAGVVAIVPRPVARALRRSPWRERLRFLDGDDPYGSAAIPWRSLPPAARDAALRAGGVGAGGDATAPSFAALVAQAGGAALVTDALRSLTAPPGDDLRGVVAAGGGVVLVADDDAAAPLLAALLLQLLALLPPIARPMVLIRPGPVAVPDALAGRALDIALGGAAGSHSTLAQTADGWTLTSADGSWQRTLLADLRRLEAAPDPHAHATLLDGLEGDEPFAPSAPHAPAQALLVAESDAPPLAPDPPAAAAPADTDAGGFSWDALRSALAESLGHEPVIVPSPRPVVAAVAAAEPVPDDEVLPRGASEQGGTDGPEAAGWAWAAPRDDPAPDLAGAAPDAPREVSLEAEMDDGGGATQIATDLAGGGLAPLDPWEVDVGDAPVRPRLSVARRRAAWRPRPARPTGSAAPALVAPPAIVGGAHTEGERGDIHEPLAAPSPAVAQEDVYEPLAAPSPAVAPVANAAPAAHQEALAVDLSGVEELLRGALAEGLGLPGLVVRVAPHVRHVAPAALRGAIRAWVAAQIAAPPPAPPPAPTLGGGAWAAPPLAPPLASSEWAVPPRVPLVATPPPAPLVSSEWAAPPRISLPAPPVAPVADLDGEGSDHVGTSEAVALLGVSRRTLQRWENAGKIRTFRDGNNNRRIPRSEVARLRAGPPTP